MRIRPPRRRRVILWSVLAACIAATAVLVLFPAVFFGVSSATLGDSVAGSANSPLSAECFGADPTWECSVFNAATSGESWYRVTVRRSGCWHAKRRENDPTAPPRLDGCVRLWHYAS